MGFFVDKSVCREPLDDQGHWVEFRRELTIGEWAQLDVEMQRCQEDGSAVALEQSDRAYLEAYLTDWHLTDHRGQPVPFSKDALRELNWQARAAIVRAIAGVQQRMNAAAGKDGAAEPMSTNGGTTEATPSPPTSAPMATAASSSD